MVIVFLSNPTCNSSSKAYWSTLSNIFRISLRLVTASPTNLVQATIKSNLVYCERLPPYFRPWSLQMIFNIGDRVIFSNPKSDHRTLLLPTLQCLSTSLRVKLKLFTMSKKSFHSLTPSYLTSITLLTYSFCFFRSGFAPP